MPQQTQDLDAIAQELFYLHSELNSFFSLYQASERAYREGHGAYSELRDQALEQSERVRKRIKGLTIDLGIHAEFLEEWHKNLTQQGFQLSVAA